MSRVSQIFALAALLVSAAAYAQEPPPNIYAVNGSVNFGGMQWWIIGDNHTTAADTGDLGGSLRLLSKNAIGGPATKYTNGSNNAYIGSIVQEKLAAAAAEMGDEASFIKVRPELDNTAVGTGTATNVPGADQKIWALSREEHSAVTGDALDFSGDYWSRSPGTFGAQYVFVGVPDGPTPLGNIEDFNLIRGALDLDLARVYEVENLGAQGKTELKFTFNLDEALNIAATDTEGILSLGATEYTLFAQIAGTDKKVELGLATNGIVDLTAFNFGTTFFANLDDGAYTLNFYGIKKNGNLFGNFYSANTDYSQVITVTGGELTGFGETTATPEPATLLVFGAGLAGVCLAKARRANSRRRK